MKDTREQTGFLYALFAYIVWGVLPIYWKLIGNVSAGEILANRILWSFIFMIILLLVTKRISKLKEALIEFKRRPKLILALATASIVVSFNWFIYIYAVSSDQVIQASLGYYMNPLVSVLLGVLVLKERLSVAQYISFGLAAIGVVILTISYGSFPWIAVGLAVSFAFYGLAKKLIPLEVSIGLTLETMFIMPFALSYVVYLFFTKSNVFASGSVTTDLLLIGAGIATAVPLLNFAKGAQAISLSTLGFLQYISPTIMLFLGVFIYDETFSKIDLIAFVFIWTALLLYYISYVKLSSLKKRGN